MPTVSLDRLSYKDKESEEAKGLDAPWKKQPISLQAPLHEQLIAGTSGRCLSITASFFSVSTAEPNWKLLGAPGAEELPTVRWKLQNLAKIDKEKRAVLIVRLKRVLKLEDPS